MKKKINLPALFFFFAAVQLFAQAPPEILHYKFDGTGTLVPNYASTPPVGTSNATIVGAQTQGSIGLCGGALIGTGTTVDYVNTGWTPVLNSSWSIAFWTSNIPSSTTLFYIFGDNTIAFRCFTNGVAGANNWMLRGTGLTDCIINGGAVMTPQLNTFVYDAGAGQLRGYLNGTLVTTVTQAAFNLNGTGVFKVGQYGTNNGLPANGLMDEFRFYSRALTQPEIQNLLSTVPLTVTASSSTVCPGNTATLNVSGASTYTWAGGSNATSLAVTPTSTSVYTVAGTNTTGCIGISAITISTTSGSVPSITATPSAICSGASATLTAGGISSYTWSNSSNNSTISVNPTSTTVYTVAGLTTGGCVSTASVSLNVNAGSPTLVVSNSTGSICLGNSVTVNASGATSYTWSNGITNNTAFTPTVTSTYTVSGQNACGITTSVTTITVTPLPVSVSSSPSGAACAGLTSSLIATTAGTSFTWTPANINSSVVAVSPAATTVYTVETSSGNCTGSTLFTLNVNPIPVVVVTASSPSVCTGTNATLTVTGGQTYTWNVAGAPPSATSIVVTVTAPTAYMVSATNSLGCTASAQQVILTALTPTVNLNASMSTICKGDPVTLTASGASLYAWGNGSTTATISDNPALTTVYTVTGTTGQCSATRTINIDVFAATVAISGPTAICSGQSVSLTASPATSYTWSNLFNTQGIVDSPGSTTVYSINVYTNYLGLNCAASASFQVLVNPSPTVTAVASPSSICKGEVTTLTANGASTYTWSDGSTTTSISITPTLITTMLYTLTGKDAQGCTGSGSTFVQVKSCNGLNDADIEQRLTIYPNPSNGNFNISFDSEVELRIINELGQVIYTSKTAEAENYSVSVTGLPKGIYFVTGRKDNTILTRKIIVE